MHKRTEQRIASVAVCVGSPGSHVWMLKDEKTGYTPANRKAAREAARKLRKKGRR
jgi:predicted secreted protein